MNWLQDSVENQIKKDNEDEDTAGGEGEKEEGGRL